jgi:hypothetical protein
MDESPAAAWFFCLNEAAAAIGTAKAEARKEDEALRRVEANTLAAGTIVACCEEIRGEWWGTCRRRVTRDYDGMRAREGWWWWW